MEEKVKQYRDNYRIVAKHPQVLKIMRFLQFHNFLHSIVIYPHSSEMCKLFFHQCYRQGILGFLSGPPHCLLFGSEMFKKCTQGETNCQKFNSSLLEGKILGFVTIESLSVS